MSDKVRRRILDAAKTLFAQYSFQRTGMADIARAAGVSRQSLYLRFSNKTELFAALARAIKDGALNAAADAWIEKQSLKKNLAAIILSKDLPLYQLLHASPHGAELLAVNAELTASFALELDRGFAAILAGRLVTLQKTGRIDVSEFGGPAVFSQTVAMAAAGIKHEMRTEAEYVDAVHRLCHIVAKAVTINENLKL
ncbi:MAG TPA: helix-turn-helix domain-containing protein [Candidatus Angelobacter sp.]|nr:helix-turn-helix domain-containing protein [Candidatus Angelobacter sp.]